MAKKSVSQAINDQMAREFAAAYQYLSMAAYFEQQNLPGFAHWMRMQNQEEVDHAMRLFQYLLDRGDSVELHAIAKPPSSWASPLAVMEASLKYEKQVTVAIHKLYALAAEENDYPTQLQLQWFIAEQQEEEKTFGDLIARMKLAGDSGPALLLMDRELGARAAAA